MSGLISKKIYVDQLSTEKLLKLRADVDRLVRLERIKRALSHIAQNPALKKNPVVADRYQQLEKELKFLEVRKALIDDMLEEMEAVIGLH